MDAVKWVLKKHKHLNSSMRRAVFIANSSDFHKRPEMLVQRFNCIQYLYDIGEITSRTLEDHLTHFIWLNPEQLDWVLDQIDNSAASSPNSTTNEEEEEEENLWSAWVLSKAEALLNIFSRLMISSFERERPLPSYAHLLSKMEEMGVAPVSLALNSKKGMEIFRLIFERFKGKKSFLEMLPTVLGGYCTSVEQSVRDGGFTRSIVKPSSGFQGEKTLCLVSFFFVEVEKERKKVFGEGKELWCFAIAPLLKIPHQKFQSLLDSILAQSFD